jgi:hypothetical protein
MESRILETIHETSNEIDAEYFNISMEKNKFRGMVIKSRLEEVR